MALESLDKKYLKVAEEKEGMVASAYNPSTLQAKAGRPGRSRPRPGLQIVSSRTARAT